MAFRLENTYTKDEILELYVNSIYFGDGYYCIYDASQGYFGKAPRNYQVSLLAHDGGESQSGLCLCQPGGGVGAGGDRRSGNLHGRGHWRSIKKLG